MKKTLICGLFAFVAAVSATAEVTVAEFPGLADEKTGWRLVKSEAGKIVYIPFEGNYVSKGGRIETAAFPLPKDPGAPSYCRLAFSARARKQGYWWVDLFDEKGEMLPDVNSALYPSEDWTDYDVVVPVCERAASAKLAFVTEAGTSVRNVRLTRIDRRAAADWCDRLYATLPQLAGADLERSKAGAFDRLPRTRAALREGRPLHVVMLGDSIMNDTYCGNVTALVQRGFPASELRFTLSVRGSTGCWYYREAENFEQYVGRYRPDLVLIGGISNRNPGMTREAATEAMVETIRRAQVLGAEVAVLSPPPSYEFRLSPEKADWHFDMKVATNKGGNCLDVAFEREAVRRTGCAFWDVTTPAANAIRDSRKPLDWFKRDAAHNDDRGKQLIARTLAEIFRAAAPSGIRTNACADAFRPE